jgi:glycerophosphoryl diester phosphodiesterase
MKKSTLIGLSRFISFSFFTFTLYTCSAASSDTSDAQLSTAHPDAKHIDVIAHRGASGYAPEHTLVAYKKAVEMNADYIELDLHMTKDGEFVAIHDATLERTTNVEEVYPNRAPWRVKDFTLAEIKKLDAGSWFNDAYPKYAKKAYANEKIPTLQEAINVIKQTNPKAALYIETKEPSVYPVMEEKLVDMLKKNGYLQKGKVIFQSFSEASLRKLKKLVPEGIPLIQLYSPAMMKGKNIDDVLNRASEYADGVAPDQVLVTHELVQKAHERHLIVHPYTVNAKEDMRKQISLGVDGMFTDYPDQLAQWNKETFTAK